MKVETTIRQLDRFKESWLSNPAAQLEFARLVEAVHQMPSRDHADAPLLEWIAEEKRTAKWLGIS